MAGLYIDEAVSRSSGLFQVFEAYGQTECTAGCTFTSPGDWTSGMFSNYWAGTSPKTFK